MLPTAPHKKYKQSITFCTVSALATLCLRDRLGAMIMSGVSSFNPFKLFDSINLAALLALSTTGAIAQETSTAATNDVFIVPFSHLDLMWAGTREECLSRGSRIIARAVQLARDHSDFRFLLED